MRMRIHRTMIPRKGVRRIIRHPHESQWIAGAVLSLPVVAAGLTVARLWDRLGGGELAAIAAVGLPPCLASLALLWNAARGSHRPSNWHVALTDRSLFLNLRHWRNAGLRRGPTVVEIGLDEIRSAEIQERVTPASRARGQAVGAPGYVELSLLADPAPIRGALAAERALALERRPKRPALVCEPVQVTERDTLLVQLTPGLTEALESVRPRPGSAIPPAAPLPSAEAASRRAGAARRAG
jgi:hypothetical protein